MEVDVPDRDQDATVANVRGTGTDLKCRGVGYTSENERSTITSKLLNVRKQLSLGTMGRRQDPVFVEYGTAAKVTKIPLQGHLVRVLGDVDGLAANDTIAELARFGLGSFRSARASHRKNYD